MGVVNLDDERKNKSSGYITISELYKRNFNKYTDDIIENQRIRNIVNEISQITNIDKMIGFVDKYKMLVNLKLDAESIIDNFIFSTVNIFSGFFILNNNYFQDKYSENHIGAVIHAPLFNNLFRQECYSMRLNDPLLANKERRNHGNEERVKLALVPDIKLAYLRGNMEIIVMEHQKQIILDGLKKNKKDTTKITIMMHDLLTKISKDLESRELSDHIKNINVFELDIEIYVMQLPAPELYIFNKIFEFSLPTNIHNFPEISQALRYLIKFRVSLFNCLTLLLSRKNINNFKNSYAAYCGSELL
ncbi:6098_t:CDS:2 [Entrophospora sp. SA101]|nr:2597_t:CDS:2 [Entrophospora sp. SA101]CAJ0827150.1 6098_t:CDS:2 [Entrophospora sp. SA101]